MVSPVWLFVALFDRLLYLSRSINLPLVENYGFQEVIFMEIDSQFGLRRVSRVICERLLTQEVDLFSNIQITNACEKRIRPLVNLRVL
jgi:hypothetical protein